MLKAGFARVDITPPFGTPLAGYYEMRYADGILDPVYLNAVALGNEEERILLITADVLMIAPFLPVADAVIVALPAPTIVTSPVLAFTVATSALFVLYVTAPSPVLVNSFVNALSK